MKCLSIQIQPDLVASVNKEEIISFLKSLGYSPEIQEGYDSENFINLNIKTNSIKTLWLKLEPYLQEQIELKESSIVTCEGSKSWDDYLLLHHFDSLEKLDKL